MQNAVQDSNLVVPEVRGGQEALSAVLAAIGHLCFDAADPNLNSRIYVRDIKCFLTKLLPPLPVTFLLSRTALFPVDAALQPAEQHYP